MPRSSAAFSSSLRSLTLKPPLSNTRASGLKTTSPEHSWIRNTEALAQALLKREVPATWNDLIREVERIRIRKNLSPFSASWHRNVGIAIKQCPFELAEATPQAIREWIDQMQDSGLTGLTINSKCSLLSGLVAKCMKSGLLRGWP